MKPISEHAIRVIARVYGQAILQGRKNRAKAKRSGANMPDYPKHPNASIPIKGKIEFI